MNGDVPIATKGMEGRQGPPADGGAGDALEGLAVGNGHAGTWHVWRGGLGGRGGRGRHAKEDEGLGRGLGAAVALVGVDDALHEGMPDDVLLVEGDERDALDVLERLGRLDQA